MRNSLLAASAVAALMAAPVSALAQTDGGTLQPGRMVTVDIPSGGMDYRLQLTSGQRIEATLRSDDFDALLQLFSEDDTGTALARDDDGLGDGTDSRLRFTPVTDGVYLLRASALSPDEQGRARVEVRNIAPAREPRTERLVLNRKTNGRLDDASGEADDGSRYDLYRMDLRAGERVVVNMESDDFDTYLRLGQTRDGVFTQLADNDDARDSLNSRILFSAPTAGQYLVRATAFDSDAAGRYTITVEEAPALPAMAVLGVGDTISGELTAANTDLRDEGLAVYYTFQAEADRSYEITLISDDFDAYLEVLDQNESVLATDDDGGGDLDARLVFLPEAAGTYIIGASSIGSGTGDFELSLTGIAPPPPPASLNPGDEIEGELTDDDAAEGSQRRYDAYRIELAEGQRVQFTARSVDFDSVLDIGEAVRKFEVMESDDDGLGDGLNARLSFTAPSSGIYEVRVRGFHEDSRGGYELAATDLGPVPVAGSIMVGGVVRSSLSERDMSHDTGAYYDDYIFHAKAGEKLRFTMIAPAFDAVLQVGEMRNETFRDLATDDDGLSDTHSRLNWTAPREGSFVIRTTSYSNNATGDYMLSMDRQP